MADLILTPDSENDLDELYVVDSEAAALIDAFVEELYYSPRVLDVLFRPANHFTFKPPFEIKRFEELWQLGKNIYTIRLYDDDDHLTPYRLLLAYHGQADRYYVLAVVHREFDYDRSHPIVERILGQYEECGIPTHAVRP